MHLHDMNLCKTVLVLAALGRFYYSNDLHDEVVS